MALSTMDRRTSFWPFRDPGVAGAIACALVLFLAGPARATPASVLELVREAREHEAQREDDIAARRYTDALGLDPTCEEAYLGLATLRARQGDAREAERVYSVALEHVPQLKAALAGRARARRALGARDLAELDLETYLSTEEDTRALRELAGWYGEDGRHAAQLGAWRRLLASAARSGDPGLGREARTMVRALQILLGPADPVASPPDAQVPARRAIASIARRAG
jgi:tetratricopeptide (TPR) repeat protein